MRFCPLWEPWLYLELVYGSSFDIGLYNDRRFELSIIHDNVIVWMLFDAVEEVLGDEQCWTMYEDNTKKRNMNEN